MDAKYITMKARLVDQLIRHAEMFHDGQFENYLEGAVSAAFAKSISEEILEALEGPNTPPKERERWQLLLEHSEKTLLRFRSCYVLVRKEAEADRPASVALVKEASSANGDEPRKERRNLTDEEIRTIQSLAKQGNTTREIADAAGLKYRTVWNYTRRDKVHSNGNGQ